MQTRSPLTSRLSILMLAALCGCSMIPEVRRAPSLHNPFPQLKRVAVLPFFNQSSERTVNGEAVAEAYYAELQAIAGFEVLPVGVTRNLYLQYCQLYGEPRSGPEFQRLAQEMGVEAIVVGSVTDFDAYYPPRMAMTTNWYAANPGFHPIPPGYGLPWGTKAEKGIPRRIAQEAEFELARQQLATQTPRPELTAGAQPSPQSASRLEALLHQGVPGEAVPPALDDEMYPGGDMYPGPVVLHPGDAPSGQPPVAMLAADASLPVQWPSPLGLIPDGPSPTPPPLVPQAEPVLTHTRLYRGDDAYFTDRLETFVGNKDDARIGGWQNYLKRSNDFIRFCCHLHLAEMLESRGGADQSDLILRWPISRY